MLVGLWRIDASNKGVIDAPQNEKCTLRVSIFVLADSPGETLLIAIVVLLHRGRKGAKYTSVFLRADYPDHYETRLYGPLRTSVALFESVAEAPFTFL